MLSPELNESQLAALREQWEAQRSAAAVKVQQLESGLGQALLTGQGEATRADLEATRRLVADADLALIEIDRLMPVARARALRLQAEGCRQKAAQFTEEAGKLSEKVAALLDKIQEIDGCRYVAPMPASKFGESPSTINRLHRQIFRLTEQSEFLEMQAQDLLSPKKASVPQWQ